ncbi:MAG: baseplate J/gp47 family protein, partial [Candidatus Competibacter sp.]
PFQVEASGEKGWVVPDSVQIESIAYTPPPGSPPSQVPLQALRLTLGFGVSSPPIAALPGAESPWPLIRLLLRSVWKDDVRGGGYATPYSLFQSLALERVLIEASVVGLKDLRLENDNGPVQAGKPFEPFGFSPAAGSGFRFVHPELVVKRLDRLETNLEWMKVPAANLVTHYKNYPAVSANDSFTAKISLVDHQLNIKLVGEAALFDADDAGAAHKISLLDIPAKIQASRPGYAYVPEFAPFGLADPASWPRYWRWELNAPDFQHGAYAQVAAAKSVALATSIAKGEKPNAVDYQVNPPYTPKLKSFSVDYGCSVEIVMAPNDPQGYGKSEERIFYRQAFGAAEIQPEQDTGLYRFLPAYGYEGELYIGLEGVAAPQSLALLFQMAEGSANPDLEPQPVEWSYLSGNRWVSLRDGGILADSTRDLVQSGIIKFHLPEAQSSTLLPANRYWLRAAVAQNCDSVCDTVAILAQAVSATWIDRGKAPDHLSQPLPPKTITKTADSVPGIATISQPYTSFGGKPGEQDALFDTRVSERLRHKQRALTLWDYEHLILEQFPGIYKVKCIPASSMEPGNLGKVDIIVIPDIRNQLPFNPFEPKATAGQIAEITDFLESHISPLAEIKVKNAYYVPVRVRVAVRFMPGCDPGFYKIRLNDELNRFLSPWAYKESNDVVIGGKLYANAIVDFLERRPYVDYVAELKLFKNEDGLSFEPVDNTGDAFGYRVQADRPDGVLVAYHQHDIDLITETRFEDEKFIGIGYMKIELDFVVN